MLLLLKSVEVPWYKALLCYYRLCRANSGPGAQSIGVAYHHLSELLCKLNHTCQCWKNGTLWLCVALEIFAEESRGMSVLSISVDLLQDRGGPLDSDGGNSRRGNTKAPVLKTRLKVICNEDKLAARHLVSGHSAASNTHQVMRESSDPGSPGNLHGSTKSSTPEDLSIQSNSVHRMVSNCSVGTMEVGVGASDKKASGGSLDKLSKDGSCALSQNGGQWSKEAGKVDNQAVKGTRTRKRGSDSSDRSVQGECQVELQPITIRRKLQRLVVKPLDRNSSISSPQRKDVEDSAEGHGQEGSALNDEELAMRLHHDLNAPSLRSRVRRSGANTSGLSRSGSLPDSARTSKTRSCPSRSGSRSFASDELHAE